MIDVEIRACTRQDMIRVCDIETACFGAGALPVLALVQYFDLFGESFAIAERQQQVVGFAIAGCVANSMDHAWILDVAVHPIECRSGIGSHLIDWLLVELLRRGVKTTSATVVPSNIASLRLFSKKGFGVIDEVADYFGPGGTRLVLRMDLGHVGLKQ